jgi:hypothetical protein
LSTTVQGSASLGSAWLQPAGAHATNKRSTPGIFLMRRTAFAPLQALFKGVPGPNGQIITLKVKKNP